MAYQKSLNRCVQGALIFSIFLSPAHADWQNPSLEFKCDSRAGVFTLRGVVEANDEFFIPHRAGFKPLPLEDQRLKCKLNGTTVSMEVLYSAPHERGYCAAVAYYAVKNLAIGKVKIFSNESFNHICGTDESLYEITIARRDRRVQITTCTGTWEWEKNYSNSKCTKRLLD